MATCHWLDLPLVPPLLTLSLTLTLNPNASTGAACSPTLMHAWTNGTSDLWAVPGLKENQEEAEEPGHIV